MVYYILLHHYNPWYKPIVVPFIPPSPISPVVISHRNLNEYGLKYPY
ncbi:hypothetical protein BGM25_07730 [Bacillus sp. FJAT-29953]|nr:hypothetical protein [Bacillus sp. FJAT-29953]